MTPLISDTETTGVGEDAQIIEAAPAVQLSDGNKDLIREVFLRNGFTIKDGREDLADYVYAAAYELLQVAPAVHREPVAYLRIDQLAHVKHMGPMLGEIANSPRVDRVAVYDTPQPAGRQPAPEVAGLVEVLEFASKTLSMACLRGEVTRRIDAALATYRKQGNKS